MYFRTLCSMEQHIPLTDRKLFNVSQTPTTICILRTNRKNLERKLRGTVQLEQSG